MKKQRTRHRRAAIIAGIAVVAVATAVLARYAASHVQSTAPKSPTESVASSAPPAAQVAAPAVRRVQNAKAAIEKPKPTPAVKTTIARTEVAPPPPPAPAAVPAVAGTAPTAMPPAADQLPVTITGCLESTVDEAQFRLTDTEGADAPQSRSWRSGFLKRHPAPVPLVALSDPHGLRKFVGRRVVATGLLTSGELRVRSLRPAGASCN